MKTSLFALVVAAAAAPKRVEPVVLFIIRCSWGWVEKGVVFYNNLLPPGQLTDAHSAVPCQRRDR